MADPRARRPAAAGPRRAPLHALARDGRARRGQDAHRSGIHQGPGAGPALVDVGARLAHRADRRDICRCARGDGRGPGGPSCRPRARRAAAMDAVAPAPRMEERRGRARLFRRRSAGPARPAIRCRLGGRTRQVAPCRGGLGHAAIRPAPRRRAARHRHDDAAADPAHQEFPRRPGLRGQPGAHARQCQKSRAGLS